MHDKYQTRSIHIYISKVVTDKGRSRIYNILLKIMLLFWKVNEVKSIHTYVYEVHFMYT